MACPYVTNPDMLAQSLVDIEDQPGQERVNKIKIKKVRVFVKPGHFIMIYIEEAWQ